MTPKKLKAAAIGGGAAGIASSIPIVNLANCICCALVVGGGMLAVYLAMRGEPATEKAPLGDGAMIGVLAGVAAAVVGAIVAIPMAAIVGDPMEMARSIMEGIEGVPPEVLEAFGGEEAAGAMAAVGLVGFLISLVVDVVFSAIGGVIGAAVFHKKPMLQTEA
ncbi:MAG: hypothetical protein OXG83_05290 [Acidobacteria bacterium]|nr:hypothetical protein [Acidobacteriota bacterium]